MNPAIKDGKAHLEAGRVDEAIRLLGNAIEDDPHDFDARLLLGIAYGKRGEFSLASDVLASALRLKPDHAGAQFNLGLAQQKAGDEEAAVAAFERVLRLEPGHDSARRALLALRPELKSTMTEEPPLEVLCACPGCGARVMRGQTGQTCDMCGVDLRPLLRGHLLVERGVRGETLHCSRCRRPVEGSDRMCTGCGFSFVTGAMSAEAPVEEARELKIPEGVSLDWGPDALAGYGQRWIAQLIDGMFFAGLGMIDSISGIGFLELLPGLILGILYETVAIGRWGQTVGKYFLDIQVDKVDGSDVTWTDAALRATVKQGLHWLQLVGMYYMMVHVAGLRYALFVMMAFPAAPSLSELWALTNTRRQALHDLTAGTVVSKG